MQALLSTVHAVATAAPAVPAKMAYGTAGFRARADVLHGVFVRVGMLAALRARQCGQMVGVMITASHNPIADNGVKIIDANGGMMAQSWEKYASALADATSEGVADVVGRIATAEGIDLAAPAPAACLVAVARDTRPSSAALQARVCQGVEALSGGTRDYGVLTTPQLHHIVRAANSAPSAASDVLSGFDVTADDASEAAYYSIMAHAYGSVLAGTDAAAAARGPLLLDCAHGVGARSAAALAPHMASYVAIVAMNTGASDAEAARLNDGCGAEHAQKERLPPEGFTPASVGTGRCASLDGDADRLVYHYFDAAGVWHLLDGDKIACLAAAFVADNLRSLGITITGERTHAHGGEAGHSSSSGSSEAVSVGIVQTAYANGASSAYIRDVLALPVVMAKTGVKFVHHAAEEFDIGVYFEANGHGTVLFHPSFIARLKGMSAASLVPAAATARARLLAASRLINQAIGDAVADAMFVEAVLALKGWSVQDWDAMYSDLPSRQLKVRVRDRAVVVTNADETRVLSPAPLQAAIDGDVSIVSHGRGFVRPSGTEDVVRVYAEAETQEAADHLAYLLCVRINEHAGGLGIPPEAAVYARGHTA